MANGVHHYDLPLETRVSILEERITYQGREVERLVRCVDNLERTASDLSASVNARVARDEAIKQTLEDVANSGGKRWDRWIAVLVAVILFATFVVGLLATVHP